MPIQFVSIYTHIYYFYQKIKNFVKETNINNKENCQNIEGQFAENAVKTKNFEKIIQQKDVKINLLEIKKASLHLTCLSTVPPICLQPPPI